MKLAINEITIGKRFRKDMGDLTALADDMKEQGLIVPIGVNADRKLIYGERRLKAAKKLGWDKIECFVIKSATDDLTIRRMEEAENNLHKPMTPAEKVALRDDIMKRESKAGGKREKGKSTDNGRFEKESDRRNEIARRAGFRSHGEYQATKKVVDSGDDVLVELVNISADPTKDRDEGLSAFEAVAVLEAPPARQKAVKESDEPRKALRNERNKARTDDQMCSDMTQRVFRAMAPINWIVDGYPVNEGEMKGCFKKFATKPPMNKRANKAGLAGLLEAVRTVREAYQMFEKELKEVIK